MMNKKLVLAAVLSTTLSVAPALAETLKEHMLVQLKSQGFSLVEVTKTWLGRTRIEAVSKTHEREIVINTRTGEILRDYWKPLDDSNVSLQELSDPKASTSDDDDGADASGGDASGGDDNGNDASGGDATGDASGAAGGGSGVDSDVGDDNDQAALFDYLNGGQIKDIDFA